MTDSRGEAAIAENEVVAHTAATSGARKLRVWRAAPVGGGTQRRRWRVALDDEEHSRALIHI